MANRFFSVCCFRHSDFHYSDCILIEHLAFTGLELLPPSLKSFKMNFSLVTQSNSLWALGLPNLRSLEFLVLASRPWYITNGIQRHKLFTNDYSHLKLKLPKLKTLRLNAANNMKEFRCGFFEDFRLISPALVDRFKKTLEIKKGEGIYLTLTWTRIPISESCVILEGHCKRKCVSEIRIT
jgi:hypothetical protein